MEINERKAFPNCGILRLMPMNDMQEKQQQMILVTGACGQIGTELVAALRAKYGVEQVIASDIHKPHRVGMAHYAALNVLNAAALENLVVKSGVTQIYHLAAVLSASGERNPLQSWEL